VARGGVAISTFQWFIVGLGAIGLVAACWLLDRLGLWLEDRGWLYYRRKKPSSSPLSSLVALQQLIEPGVQHVVGVGRQRRAEDDNGEAPHRLLACLRDSLNATPVNPEAVRLYLTQAQREGLDWQELYAEAVRGLPEHLVPPLTDVAPFD
jgi:hypothetical protein